MKEQFVPYKIAKSLKELGFREKCFSKYDYDGDLLESSVLYPGDFNDEILFTSAPLYQQVIQWFVLRGIIIVIYPLNRQIEGTSLTTTVFESTIQSNFIEEDDTFSEDSIFDTYEDALKDAIKDAIKLYKEVILPKKHE